MRLPTAPRVVLDVSLRLARVPVDAAIELMPERRAGPRAAARRVLDTVDSGTRSLLGLGARDGEMREPRSDPPADASAPTPRRSVAATRPPARAPSRPPSHAEIAARAFELYEWGVPGDAETHWQAAERELSAREP